MPVLKEAEPLRIIQITDLHLHASEEERLDWCAGGRELNTTETLSTVLDDIQVNEPWFDALVVTGDIAQDGETAAYRRFARLLGGEGAPVYCLPGNHDDRRRLAAALGDGTVSMPRQVVMRDWLLLFVDSACRSDNRGEISTIQLAWIEAMAARHPEHHIVVFTHHHPVPVGSKWLDGEYGMVNGEAMLAHLGGIGRVRAIVCGHIHQQLDRMVDGIRILGTPSTCLQFEPQSDLLAFTSQAPAYRRLALYPDGRIDTAVVFSHQPAGPGFTGAPDRYRNGVPGRAF